MKKIYTIAGMLWLFTACIPLGIAGECDTQEQIADSSKNLMQDAQAMQMNVQGFQAKVNQAFDTAAKQYQWTPLQRANIHKKIMSSKNVAELTQQVNANAKDLRQELASFNQHTLRQKTTEACLQRVKVKALISKVNAAIDRELNDITQQISQAQSNTSAM